MKEKLNACKFIISFAKDDFKQKYAGSVGGILWGFIQPFTTIILYWFVFQLVFHNQDVDGIPYILWLVSGLLVWFYVGDTIPSSVGTLQEYSYLIKKIKFNIDILPLIKPISGLFVHFFLVIITAIFMLLYGFKVNLKWIFLIYYTLYIFLFCCGFSYFLSTLYVFFKDVSQVVSVLMQVIFWITPIVWNISLLEDFPILKKIIEHTPLFYAVNGYREILLNQTQALGYNSIEIVGYWFIILLFLFIGIFVFKKCKKHFSDVL